MRHYERKGVLAVPRRSRNGYREYPAEALERVRLVRRALAVGFTLDALARILKERARGRAPAIHRFLSFQIKEHQTGDSLEVETMNR